jgi:hypothetical protein
VYGHLAPSAFRVVKKPGEWNKMKISAKGKNIQVCSERKKIINMDMSLWTSGQRTRTARVILWLPNPYAGLPHERIHRAFREARSGVNLVQKH